MRGSGPSPHGQSGSLDTRQPAYCSKIQMGVYGVLSQLVGMATAAYPGPGVDMFFETMIGRSIVSPCTFVPTRTNPDVAFPPKAVMIYPSLAVCWAAAA